MKLPARTLGLSLVAMALLAACHDSDPQAPTITRQPASLTVAEGAPAVFSVAADGDAPLAYAWLNAADSSPVPGATGDTFTVPAAALADSGKAVQVRVSNAAGSVTSQAATLTVTERGLSAAADVVAGVFLRNHAAVADSHGHIHVVSIHGDHDADVRARLKLRSADSSQANDLLPVATLQASEALAEPSTSLRVAANTAAHVMAVWHRNGVVSAALYTPGPNPDAAGSWRPLPTRVSSSGASSALVPTVTAVGNTHFEFAWRERSGASGPHDIKARRYTIASDQLDGTIATLEGSDDDTGAPQLVADAAGNLVAAWDYSEGGVVFNRRAAGSAWSTSTTLAEGGSGQRLERLVSNAAGRALLLTRDPVGGAGTFVRLDLTSATPMAQVGGCHSFGSSPDAYIFPDGRIRLFGVSVDTDNGNTSRLSQWSANASGAWGGAEPVSDIATEDFVATRNGILNPHVVGADAAGNLRVAWEQRSTADGGRGRIHVGHGRCPFGARGGGPDA
jgi:hypothetical protein